MFLNATASTSSTHALMNSPSFVEMRGHHTPADFTHLDGRIFSLEERQTRELEVFSLLEKKLGTERGKTTHLRTLFQHISHLSSSDENALIVAEIGQAFLKKQAYLRRYFSCEPLSEWPEHRTHLGKVFSRFTDCMESTIPVRRFFKSLTKEELQRADKEAFVLLKKMENPPPSLEPTFLSKRMRPLPSLPSTMLAYSIMYRLPQAIPAIFLWGMLSQVQPSAASSYPSSSIEIGEGYRSGVPIAISGTKVFIPSNTSSFIRVFETNNPTKPVEMEPIRDFPTGQIENIGASDSRLAIWQPADPTKIHFVTLECKIPEASTEEKSWNKFWIGILIGGIANLLFTIPLYMYLFIAKRAEKTFLHSIIKSSIIRKVTLPHNSESFDSVTKGEEYTDE